MLSTLLDLAGAVCLIAFAYLLFPPAALGVAAVLFFVASFRRGSR